MLHYGVTGESAGWTFTFDIRDVNCMVIFGQVQNHELWFVIHP